MGPTDLPPQWKDETATVERLPEDEAEIKKSELDNLGVWATVKRFKKAVLLCNLLCIAAAADGYQYTLNGNVIANLGFIRHVGFLNDEGEYELNADHTALWGAMQSLGQMVGMLFLNPISDALGRKATLYVLWVIHCGAILLETFVRDWRGWAGAKLTAGIGIGAIQSTLPVFISEWAPANCRGAMVLAYGFWNALGKFLAPLVLTVREAADPYDYKVPILTQCAFVGIMLPILLWLPETPSYYAARDMDDRGKAMLRRVNGNVQGYDVDAEYAIIRNTIVHEFKRDEATRERGWKSTLRSYGTCFSRLHARRTLGAALPACAQQLTGLAFLNVYSSLFFRQSGFDNAFLITTITTVPAVATIAGLILGTDRFGRRNIVLASTAICTTAMLIVGILGQVEATPPLKDFLIFIACVWSLFSAALGALGWSFVGEVASQKLRARTAGIAAAMSVVFGLTFNTTVPVVLDPSGVDWGYNTAWLFTATGAAMCAITWLFVPEPAQRNSAKMDEMYEKGVSAWRMKKFVTNVQTERAAGGTFAETK
ncbi:uncharacterized protein LTR77_002803 [Saxophila tyrrhenica]|uniref:Major facilitator superfamily (MFS) profile domain-containing protein n=1 Tax=Saxophila tyrrhenica TaxID=1690608 RepID=A0AAV9PK01_9PEZI|nr:hypothetical protein LTR77_002803 [Saxophila tyrrhenica]